MEEIIKTIENQTDKKKRHYLKIDNNSHSMVIAFNAFEINKSKVAMETNCIGIKDIKYDNYNTEFSSMALGNRGVSKLAIGQDGCADMKKAIELGNKNIVETYITYCK